MRSYRYWKTGNRWYWHRVAGGRIVSDSGQGYATKWGVHRAMTKDADGRKYIRVQIDSETAARTLR
jgi:hypothetical protein